MPSTQLQLECMQLYLLLGCLPFAALLCLPWATWQTKSWNRFQIQNTVGAVSVGMNLIVRPMLRWLSEALRVKKTYMHIVHKYLHIYIYVYIEIYIYTYLDLNINIFIYLYICVYIYTYVGICLYLYIYIFWAHGWVSRLSIAVSWHRTGLTKPWSGVIFWKDNFLDNKTVWLLSFFRRSFRGKKLARLSQNLSTLWLWPRNQNPCESKLIPFKSQIVFLDMV